MKTASVQQEILLITGTKFSTREWAERSSEEGNKLSVNDQLEYACWNGLLDIILPELMEKTAEGKKLFLWHIRHCKSFLEIELSESSPVIERDSSIDPYFFVPGLLLN